MRPTIDSATLLVGKKNKHKFVGDQSTMGINKECLQVPRRIQGVQNLLFVDVYKNITAARPAIPTRPCAAAVIIGAPADEVAEAADEDAEDALELADAEAEDRLELMLDSEEDSADDSDEAADEEAELAPDSPAKMVELPMVLVMVLPSVVIVVSTGTVEMALPDSPPA